MTRALQLLLICVTYPLQAAEPASNTFAVSGAGMTACGDAVHMISTREVNEQSRVNAYEMFQWVQGYIAAYNGRGVFDDPTRIRPSMHITPPLRETVYLFIDGYCRKHPTAHVIHATDALLRELGAAVYIPKGWD